MQIYQHPWSSPSHSDSYHSGGSDEIPILGGIAEAWEARRRITKYRKSSKSIEAIYDRLRCIGHENAHRSRIEERITEILAEVSVDGK